MDKPWVSYDKLLQIIKDYGGKEQRFSLQVASCNDTLRDVTERVLCKVKLSHLVSVKVKKYVGFRIVSVCVY